MCGEEKREMQEMASAIHSFTHAKLLLLNGLLEVFFKEDLSCFYCAKMSPEAFLSEYLNLIIEMTFNGMRS